MQVSFPAKNLVRFRPLVVWSHALRLSRIGDWERLGRDTERFRGRIASSALILDPILTQSHRDRVQKKLNQYLAN